MSNAGNSGSARLAGLCGRSAIPAYLLNIVLPGLGNCIYGRPAIGTLLIFVSLMAVLLFFFGALAGVLGLIIIVISIIGAFFTFGLTLIVLPVGILMLVMGAGPLMSAIMYGFALIVSEILVARTSDKLTQPGVCKTS